MARAQSGGDGVTQTERGMSTGGGERRESQAKWRDCRSERTKRKKERLAERERKLTYPGTASGILHTPPRRLHTHTHAHSDRGARRAAAETNQ